MPKISTKTHGYLDYIVGILFIISPWAFGFAHGGAETRIPVILGAGAILYSLLTNYEMGVAKVFSMPVHLGLDIVSGILLAMSPWLFHFSDYVYLPHLILGIGEILAATFTSTVPSNGAGPTGSSTGAHVPYTANK